MQEPTHIKVSNPSRLSILSAIQAAFMSPYSISRNLELQTLLSDFSNSSRGKSKSKGFIKSWALSKYHTNSAKPHSGKKEAARNLASGKVGLDYNALRALAKDRRICNHENDYIIPF